MIKVWIFDSFNIPFNFSLLLFMFVSHLVRYGMNFSFISIIKTDALLMIFYLTYIVDIVQCVLLGRLNFFGHFIYLLNIFLFMSYMYNLYRHKGGDIQLIAKPYIYYSIYNVLVVLLSATLIYLGFLSITSNPLSNNSLIETHMELGGQHFFPGHLSVCTQDSRILGDYGIPMLTGLSHEPHVLNYLILPSCFILLNRYSKSSVKKILLYISYILVMMIAMSSTAIICFILIVMLDLIWSFIISRKFISILPIILIILLVVVFGSSFIESIQTEIFRKLTSPDSNSMNFTSSMLKYIVSPSGLVGYGNLPPENGPLILRFNIGLITCLMDIVLYILMIHHSLRLIFAKNHMCHYFGLAFLYFILHNLKVNIMSFTYPYFAYIIFLIYLVYGMYMNKIPTPIKQRSNV